MRSLAQINAEITALEAARDSILGGTFDSVKSLMSQGKAITFSSPAEALDWITKRIDELYAHKDRLSGTGQTSMFTRTRVVGV